ncbi:hydroxymethylbilane synthase [Thermosyntropha lipolytica DSM 11003]|uniref:Porphobilinogen deaminase n=1 Tax=Thermosyntropha lipolytica DSM 11003 TaxID=1123382 RepID=A0A1M5NJC7_9FIRM|nr:hydroxymethylbilane synthase [Thermosyntropha lipolytica]SHG89650.1 hydroxymethylbilane synthase [Thermosyntropha lipolytica DSM 11003]
MTTLKLGTRGSQLAVWQARQVAWRIKEEFPDINIQIYTVRTKGDKILDVALSKIGDKGLFTKEIEKELLSGNIDIAVHSMKDLPSVLERGLTLGAVLKRENPQDVLVSARRYKFDSLPEGAVIGTSSLRRTAQIKAARPDINVVDIRGNVETRIRKMMENDLDAIVVAYAGVKRLNLETYISDYLPYEIMLPAVGQGAIAVECREGDQKVLRILKRINDQATMAEVRAERAFMRTLEGGCQMPVGALARSLEGKLVLEGLIASLDGRMVYRDKMEGSIDYPEELGIKLAQKLLKEGGEKIWQDIKWQGN